MPRAGCVVVGRNGHGKTSLIEAMLYAEVFRSFRGAADRELVRHGADGFFVEATSAGNGPGRETRKVSVGFDARTRGKRVRLDGVEAARLSEAIGVVRGVVLSPGDVSLVSGGPRERRRFLDVLLSLTVRGYVEALARYRRALLQRARASRADVQAWEEVLAEAGAVLVASRREWVGAMAGRYSDLCVDIGESAPGADGAGPRLSYSARTDGGVEELRTALAGSREKDRALGRTSVGPHRDDLRMTLAGRDLRTYGSAGQQRTAALALRLVEADTLSAAGDAAIIALDDAFAELDSERSARLGALVERLADGGHQVVAAVPKAGDVPDAVGALPRWRVADGRVEETA